MRLPEKVKVVASTESNFILLVHWAPGLIASALGKARWWNEVAYFEN
jgi:hypothetical protein